jgi:hypothetical protein
MGLWEERRETRDGDVLGEEVSDRAFGEGVFIPDIGFR